MPDVSPSPIDQQVLAVVAQTLREYEMLQPDDRVLAGVSGGGDSVALLDALLALQADMSFSLGIAHLNHTLRQEASERDEAFVRDLARRLDVPVYVQRQDVRGYGVEMKMSPEEAGREARYRFLTRTAREHGYTRIALGHHSDDSAEWVLMNILRGSGMRGLSGIPPVRGMFIRPLIRLSRKRINEYLTARGIDFVVDQTNMDPRFLRNRIRHSLIPALEKSFNPKVTEALNRLALIQQSEESWLESVLDPLWQEVLIAFSDHQVVLGLEALNSLHPAARRRILRRAVEKVKGDLRRISLAHMEAFADLLQRGPSDGMLTLPDRIAVERQGNRVRVFRRRSPGRGPDRGRSIKNASYQYIMDKPGKIYIKELNAYLNVTEVDSQPVSAMKQAGQRVAFFDMNTISFPLLLRSIRPGDRFRPMGLYGTQKVKKYLIDHKVAREDRPRHPVLVSGGEIIWLVGQRIDESVKVKNSTQKILRAELSLASKIKDV